VLQKILALALLAGLAGGAVWAVGRFGGASTGGQDVSAPIHEARMRPFSVRLSSLGALEAASSRDVAAPFSGKVVKLLPEGTLVEAGQPILWMDTTDYEEQLKEFEVNLATQKSDVTQAEEDHQLHLVSQELTEASLKAKEEFQERKREDSQQQYENTKKLVASSLAPMSDLEDRKIQMLQADLSLEEARIALDKFNRTRASQALISHTKIDKAAIMVSKWEKNVADRKEDLESATILAPGPGHLNFMMVRMGGVYEKVSEGSSIYGGTPIIQIPDSTTMLAKVPVGEVDITKVEVDQRADVRVMAFPDAAYQGKVIKKSLVPIEETSFRKLIMGAAGGGSLKEFEVVIELQEEDPELRQGMTVSVDIIVAEEERRLAVPQEAVFEHEGVDVVFLARAGGFERVPVKRGITNLNFVELLEGVSEGDDLYLRDPSRQLGGADALEEIGL
jgi:HlyD family secretion protein